MKKIITLFLTLTIAMSALTACGAPEEKYHNINENVSIIDAKVSKVDSNDGRFPYHKIWFEKDGKATEFDVGANLYSDVAKILNTAKMVNKEKDIRFDIVTDGKEIISVTLSSNRK